jgi:Tol biopolymer transport system component
VVALAGLGAAVALRPKPEPPLPVHVSIEAPPDARVLFSGDLAGPPVLSPDGTMVAFSAIRDGELRRLWVRDLREPEPRELEGTEGALFPFWSPDGREIGFFTTESIRRFDLASGTVQRVCDADQGRGGSWTDDGRIIFAPSFRGGLSIVNAQGGAPSPLTEPDAELHTSHRWPFVIPGTGRFLFIAVTARAGESENNAVYLGSLSGETAPVRLLRCDYSAEYAEGHLLFVRDRVLLASPLDLASGEVRGEQRVIARDVAADLSTWHGQFSASGAGAIVFNRRRDIARSGDAPRGYAWSVEGDRVTSFDETGRMLTSYANDTPMRSIALSPDGRTLAIERISEDGATDLWAHPTAWSPAEQAPDDETLRAAIIAPEPRRITFLEGAEASPVWSPDNAEIAFRWDGDGTRPRGIYRKRVGGGAETLVYDNEGGNEYPVDWTADGRYLVTVSGTLIMSELNDIYAVPLDGGERIPLVTDAGADYMADVSPDGRWLAYTSRAGGRAQVYVIPFAPAWPDGQAGRRWLVSGNGGRLPRWSGDGQELYYISDSAILIELQVDTSGDAFVFSSPRALFQTPYDTGRNYDVMPKRSDQGLFVFMDSGEDRDAPAALILNWTSLLDEN